MNGDPQLDGISNEPNTLDICLNRIDSSTQFTPEFREELKNAISRIYAELVDLKEKYTPKFRTEGILESFDLMLYCIELILEIAYTQENESVILAIINKVDPGMGYGFKLKQLIEIQSEISHYEELDAIDSFRIYFEENYLMGKTLDELLLNELRETRHTLSEVQWANIEKILKIICVITISGFFDESNAEEFLCSLVRASHLDFSMNGVTNDLPSWQAIVALS